MDPEKMLKIINEVRANLEQKPMTLDEYNSIANADNGIMEKCKAAQEARRHHLIRKNELGKRYPVHGSPLARCYFLLMKEEKTQEDIEYNKGIAEKARTPEGSAELFEEIVRRAAQLPTSVFFPKDDFEMIRNYEKYGDTMDALFTIKLTRDDVKNAGIICSPGVEKFLDNHAGAFDIFGKMSGVINLWASPFYPVFGEPDINNITPIMLAQKNKNDGEISPEQEEFNIYSEAAFAPIQYDEERNVINGGRKLVESDKLKDHKYAAENIYNAAKKAAEEKTEKADKGAGLKILDEKGKENLDKELSGRFAMTAAQLEAKEAEAVKEILDEGVFSQGRYSFEKADYRLLKLFGPEFEYDDEQLKENSYTRDVFKVNNYQLPEGCPFSENEAALIGLFSMSQKGIGDLSRNKIISDNFELCQENMMCRSAREHIGDEMLDSIKKARETVPDAIRKYMDKENTDKTQLAEILASGIHMSAQSLASSGNAKLSTCFEARNLTMAMGIIRRDPELGKIIKDKKLLNENDLKAAKLASVMNRYFEERADCLNRFYKELKEGRLPSDELKQELVTRVLTFNLIHWQRGRDNHAYEHTEEFLKKSNEIENKSSDIHEMEVQLKELIHAEPFSEFDEKLMRTGGFETLENLVKDSKYAKMLLTKSSKELAEGLELFQNEADLNDNMSKVLRTELNSLKPFTEKIAMDIKNPYTPATRESIAEDIQILSELGRGMEDAQKNVHMGSGEFDKVVKDIKLLEEAGKGLGSGQYLLDGKNAGNMRLMYAGLQKHCEAYLARKERQGLLDADPESKPGKRIKMVREVLKFSRQGEARFSASEEEVKTFRSEADKTLYDSLEPESAAAMMKKLNELAGNNSNPEYGERIVNTLNLVVKYMKEKNVQSENIGLEQKDYENAATVIKNKGVGKKPEKGKDNKTVKAKNQAVK